MFNRCSRYLFHLQNADGKPLEGTDEDYEGAVAQYENLKGYGTMSLIGMIFHVA